jgi:hypothetical protein
MIHASVLLGETWYRILHVDAQADKFKLLWRASQRRASLEALDLAICFRFFTLCNRNTTMSMLDHPETMTLLTINHAGLSNIYNISKWGVDDYELGSFLSQEINLREPKVQNVLVRTTTTNRQATGQIICSPLCESVT